MGPPFSLSMEWTGRQQIWFLLQSVGLGIVEGLLLDTVTSFIPPVKRNCYFWTDVAFGPFAAVVTFFGALVIMDGQLHPILFMGCALGMILEHVILGMWLAKWIYCMRLFFGKIGVFLGSTLKSMGRITKKRRKSRKNREKRA